MASRIITAEEERELGIRMKRGDAAARSEFLDRTMAFAWAAARKSWRRGGERIDFEELLQAARLGVVEAAGKFDPSLGIRFAFFARQHMNARMSEVIRAARTHAHIPPHVHVAVEKSAKGKPYGKVSDVCMAKAREVLARATVYISPRSPEAREFEPAAPEPSAELLDLREKVRGCLDHLCGRDREVIRRRFGLDGRTPETYERIALSVGITEGAARKCFYRLRDRSTGRSRPKARPRGRKGGRRRKAVPECIFA